MAYVFPPGADCQALLAEWERLGWRAQITGPHGSGKSALVAAIVVAAKARGCTIHQVELHDGQRSLPGGLGALSNLTPGTLLIVDGYEQLAFWHRWRLRHFCRKRSLGLLVTAHRSVGLPSLYKTESNLALAEQIVQSLLKDRPWPVTRTAFERCFIRHQGDLRELLFELYDAYEQQRRGRPDRLGD